MIANAADYRFVDFANGDLPTDRFDGSVMPLRRGDAQGTLKAEDIAFLYEGMRDKIGAMMGAKIHGTDVETFVYPGSSRSPRGHSYSPDPVAIPLTKSIRSSQMTYLCDYMSASAASGDTGVRFVDTPLAQIETHYHSTTTYPRRTDLPPIVTGVSPLAADRTDFAVGKPVAKGPVLDLFDDMKLFDKPIWFAGIDIASTFDETCFASGSPSGDAGRYIGYTMSRGMQYAYTNRFADRVELLSIPLAYAASPIRLWMRFGAFNIYAYEREQGKPSSTEWVSDFRTGMIDATQYFPSADENGYRNYTAFGVYSLRLLRAIEDLYGWTEYGLGGSYIQQDINVTWMTDFIVEFTPNGRTKWW